MKHRSIGSILALLLLTARSPLVHAIDLSAGDWKFSIEGNVNASFIYDWCQTSPVTISGGLACVTNNGNSAAVANGLLPAALTFNGKTTVQGYDVGFTFGLYPGIDTIDGGSPNLLTTPPTNVALGTAGLDIRQVFLTFGNDSVGTIMAGRNIGLFQGDAILNDMTLIGVGAGNGNYAAPANTSLGSIGLGYIYTDWLAQINYTTPTFRGFNVTLGVFDPLNTLGQTVPTNKNAPAVQGKGVFKAGGLYLSASFLWQKQTGTTSLTSSAPPTGNYNSHAFDAGGKYDIGGLEVMGWYYHGWGVGTTGLFIMSNDAAGTPRYSNGFLTQITYKIGPTKFGVNYGQSKLDLAAGEINPTLLEKNDKWTVGVYQDLNKYLTLTTEFTRIRSENQIGEQNVSRNVDIGLFLKF
jgi:predicted porin